MTAAQSKTAAAPALLLTNRERRPARVYTAYGLNLRSQLPLPEFEPVSLPGVCVDVKIMFGSGDDWIPEVRERSSFWYVDTRDARFWFQGVGGFRIRNGCEIVLTPEAGIDDALLRMYVEGMMMATLLHQRGFFVLHAGVVQIENTCVALMGHVGAGKSSTVAALHRRGHAVVTDDNAAISFSTEGSMVTPAFPFIKIFPGIAEALGFPEHLLRRMHPSQPKFVTSVAGGFPSVAVPLSAVYILTRDAEPQVAPLSPAETIIELVRNSVPARWKLAGGEPHLRQCAALAARVPAFRLRTFRELSGLPELAETIERHRSGAGSV